MKLNRVFVVVYYFSNRGGVVNGVHRDWWAALSQACHVASQSCGDIPYNRFESIAVDGPVTIVHQDGRRIEVEITEIAE